MDFSQEEFLLIASYIKPNKYLILALVCKYYKDILYNFFGKGRLQVNLNYITSTFSLLTYAYNIGIPKKLYKKLCSSASYNGNIEGLTFLLDKKMLLDKSSAVQAAKNDKLECLKFISKINPNLLGKDSLIRAANYGNLECLEYIFQTRGYDVLNAIATKMAAKHGHLNCLKFLHKFGCPWNQYCSSSAAENGHLECLQYAVANNCPVNSYICLLSAKNGHIECFDFSLKVDYKFLIKKVYFLAIKYGQLEIIKYIFNSRYKNRVFNVAELAPTNFAAGNGQLEMLQFLHENGCAWNETLYIIAIESINVDNLKCLKYAYEKGCPILLTESKEVAHFNLHNLKREFGWYEIDCDELIASNGVEFQSWKNYKKIARLLEIIEFLDSL